ncbi:hypothetical protein [Tenacibaculum jejuense]|uniref:Uncharacterized protein n=1 Tax=Tenacibaculum jejuense TaxID=584609 RepID=A0A238UCG5_9FLAO|nr:hypothetical protein [Tenacibaculum jejuense]SNR16100.1 Probable transmembrane protein of unknown function [Tenacibaculum jejuense]
MITTDNTAIQNITYTKPTNIIDLINHKIKVEQENAFGITVLFIMISTMISSATAALAIHHQFSFMYLALALVTAMGTNATAFSQSPFKYVAWAGIISITTNIVLILMQLITLYF